MNRHIALLLSVAILGLGCRKEEKPQVRTEPWAAPRVSTSSSAPLGAGIRYVLDRGSVQIDLGTKARRTTARIDRVEGSLDLDPVRLERTRGSVRFDLLGMSLFGAGETEEDPSLTLRALGALDLTPERPSEERERVRFAEVRVVGFDLPSAAEAAGRRSDKAALRAFIELTLHRFRVPHTVDLQVEWVSDADGGPETLSVRTRRPLVISLVAHDILPKEKDGSTSSDPTRSMGHEFAREARVSAELWFHPTPAEGTNSGNP